jgi:hypothetical protein
MKYARYLRYLIIHKWWVFLECRRLGIPWLGITHDLSKFRLSEFISYAEYFYGGPRRPLADYSAYEKTWYWGIIERECKEAVQDRFDAAWLAHQHANKHHWQHYVLREDDGGLKVLPMPDRYRREMLADWRGAGRAITGKDNTAEWFQKNRAHMILHPDTARWLYDQLGRRHSLEVSQTEGSAP